MADPRLSTPVPDDEDDEALFGHGAAQDGQHPPAQPTGASASAGGPATVVGLDPQLQQMMVQMNQQQTLQVLVAKMEADERGMLVGRISNCSPTPGEACHLEFSIWGLGLKPYPANLIHPMNMYE